MILNSRNRQFPRIDWQAERERIDLADVVTDLLGPPPGRRGEGGRKLWWKCPYHDDSNPSFSVEPGKLWWKCWGCGESGDAAKLFMKMRNVSFPEVIAHLTCRSDAVGAINSVPRPKPIRAQFPPREKSRSDGPKGLPEAEALAVVAEAEARLWSPEGSPDLAYL